MLYVAPLVYGSSNSVAKGSSILLLQIQVQVEVLRVSIEVLRMKWCQVLNNSYLD